MSSRRRTNSSSRAKSKPISVTCTTAKIATTAFRSECASPIERSARSPGASRDAVWNRRVGEARGHLNNFALYNAPPNTMQRMPVYFYLSPSDSRSTQQAVMAFTHDDVYKPMPGYKVLVSHFHFHFNEQLTMPGRWTRSRRGCPFSAISGSTSRYWPTSTPTRIRTTPARVRLDEQKVYFQGCERFSDRDFLLIPGEEPDRNFGGHYMFMFPQAAVLHACQGRAAGAGSRLRKLCRATARCTTPAPLPMSWKCLTKEAGLVWQTHPRTKGSTGYPDAISDKDFFQSDRFLGGSFQSLPVDLSRKAAYASSAASACWTT